MSIFKCKMCGGTIEFEEGSTVGVCDSCGTRQTIPRLDTERKANLYDRADHFRRNNDFDKAVGIFEQILNEDPTDAEAYWSLVLCRYGIEYVEDPSSHKRVPTINRAQFTSIFDDEDYKSALQHADIYQRALYEEEANTINEIQKGILAISQNEDPFDIFICYKETDNNGRRTPDSVLANDLYYQLTQEGFKVFFSRITLEDKLGTAYEPYIFAALNSAKVMVVLGTKPEYFNAVWVKNEWSRYLTLVRQSNGKKVLIPAYRDMDPYDLPEEFSHLQAQDMSKLGFMQDLIRGIKKITQTESVRVQPAVNQAIINNNQASNSDALLRRAFLFLEDGEWDSAENYLEQVLDSDPENAQAYLGKLMLDLHVKTQDELGDRDEPYDDNGNYQKALRFADGELKATLENYVLEITERKEQEEYNKKSGIFEKATEILNFAKTEEEFRSAGELFQSISGFKKDIPGSMDADAMAVICFKAAEEYRIKDAIYDNAKSRMTRNSRFDYESAITKFKTIPGWKDADEQIIICEKRIEEIKEKEEAEILERERIKEENRIAEEKAQAKRKRNRIIVMTSISALVLIYSLLVFAILPVIRVSAQKKALTDVAVGQTIKFGLYEQDNIIINGKEEIEWIVLSVEDNRALVISKYALDCKLYNETSGSTTWGKCTLRTWLNEWFYHKAFGSDLQNMIASSLVTADVNPSYNTFPGNDTTDKVFLLSITEASKYFSSDSARKCQGTAYCYARGAYRGSNYDDNCRWWLRSPGYNSSNAAGVNTSGSVRHDGNDVHLDNIAVRPALWIEIE